MKLLDDSRALDQGLTVIFKDEINWNDKSKAKKNGEYRRFLIAYKRY